MPKSLEDQRFAQQNATMFHPISAEDKTAMAGLRAIVEPNKGSLRGTAARVPFDAIMERVAIPEDGFFEVGTVGGRGPVRTYHQRKPPIEDARSNRRMNHVETE